MPSTYYNIKQKTQADIVLDAPHIGSAYHRTITYDNNSRTLIAYNFPQSQVFNFTEDEVVDFGIINKNTASRTSFTDYDEGNKTLNISDKSYSDDSGGGIIIPKISIKEVEIGGGAKTVSCYYYTFTLDTLQASENIIKFGYCCNDNYGKDFPLFIFFGKRTSGGEEKCFYPGKEGMYEFQPEYWENELIYPEKISEITIPVGPSLYTPFSFVLDYVIM